MSLATDIATCNAHADAGGDLCTDDSRGCCVDCHVLLTTCPECQGIGYHRGGCESADVDDWGEIEIEVAPPSRWAARR